MMAGLPVQRLSSPAARGLRVDDCELVAPRAGQGLGDVWTAERARGGAAAVKFVGPAEAAAAQRFEEQVRRLARVTSPNLATLHGGGVSGSWLYVVTEAVEARTLEDWLAGQRETGAPVPAGVALHLFDSVCGALQGAHRQGVAHGALSPVTVLLRALAPGTYHPWVLDLGLGAWVRDASLVAAIEAPPAAYLAPEQDAGGDGTPRSDVFSLGLLLVELLCGTVAPGCGPRETLAQGVGRIHRGLAGQLAALRNDVHEDFWTTLAAALHPDPAQRPESAQQLKGRVRAAAQNAGLWRDTPEPTPEPPAPQAGRRVGAVAPRGRDATAPEGWQHAERDRGGPPATAAGLSRSVRAPRVVRPTQGTIDPPVGAPPERASAPAEPPRVEAPAATVPTLATAAASARASVEPGAAGWSHGASATFAEPAEDDLGTVRAAALEAFDETPPAAPAEPMRRSASATTDLGDGRSAFQTVAANRGFAASASAGDPTATMKVARHSLPGLAAPPAEDPQESTMADPPPSPPAAWGAPAPPFAPPTPFAPSGGQPSPSFGPPAGVTPDATLQAARGPRDHAAPPFVLRPPAALPRARGSRWWIAPAAILALLAAVLVAWLAATATATGP